MDTVERFVNAQEESYGQTLTKNKKWSKAQPLDVACFSPV